MSKVVTAQEAAKLIKDGVTVGASTQGLSGWAEEVAIAIEERFKQSGHPGISPWSIAAPAAIIKKGARRALGTKG